MRATAKKSTTTTSTTVIQKANRPFFAKAGGGDFFAPKAKTTAPFIQAKMSVNKPGDKFEQEADKMADKVIRMPAPPSPMRAKALQRQTDDELQKRDQEEIQKEDLPEEQVQKQEQEEIQKAEPEEQVQKQEQEEIQKAEPEEQVQKQEDEKIQQAPAEEEKLQRRGFGTQSVDSVTQSAIHNKVTGGQPLSSDVRGYMEPRFNADFSNVRVHSNAESAGLSNRLSARAFTYQNHIFFSREQYQPGTSEGKKLLAHELTHTIQQGHAVQRSRHVTTTPTQPHIQRSGGSRILNWIAKKAYHIPGFRMFTIILGVNPINMSKVDRSAANILRALIEFMPGGALITQALDNHGIVNKVADWLEKKIKALGMVGGMFKNALDKFIGSLGMSDLAFWNWGNVWDRAKRIFTAPIDRLIAFAKGVVKDLFKFVKDAILRPLAALAKGTRGYDLLRAILGQDPITGEPVPRTAETIIGGFMKLIGREDIWENIKKGNAIARAWAWFQGALSGLMKFVRSIPGQIIKALSSITWKDVITIVGVFAKVGKAFLNIGGQFFSWAGRQVISLLEIIFTVVAPKAVPYIKRAKGAFRSIIQNPIRFVRNLVRAGKLGFRMFASRIGHHLKTALIKWIVGPLGEAGVYIPQSFSLMEIIKLVLSVLGLTWQNIRAKLVKIIPEPVLAGLEKTVGILVTLVKEGPVAAWEQIKSELSELKDMLIAKITEMVTSQIVKAAVVKLASMLNPAGAVIQAIIAIYNTISFFIEKASQIAAVVGSFINSISAIAAGRMKGAAKRVEQTMANTLTVVIAFLAKFAGLGNIPAKLVGIIKKIRKPIDKGLDKIVAWIVKQVKRLARSMVSGVRGVVRAILRRPVRVGRERHQIVVDSSSTRSRLLIESTPQNFSTWLRTWRPEVMNRARAYDNRSQVAQKFSSIDRILSRTQRRADIPQEDVDQIAGVIQDISGMVRLDQEVKTLLYDLSRGDLPVLERSLRNLISASAIAASLAIQARNIERENTPDSLSTRRRGIAGVGIGLVLMADGSVRKVFSLNDVLLNEGTDTVLITQFRQMYQGIIASLTGAGFQLVGGGTIRIVSNEEQQAIAGAHGIRTQDAIRSIQGHEEDLIREALVGNAHRLSRRGTAVVVGVPQATVCNRCVVRLSSGESRPLPVGFSGGERHRSEHALIAAVAPGEEARMLVLGRQLAEAIGRI